MQQALQIHFHGMDRSEALEARVRERMAELEQLCTGLTSGRVTVEKDPRQHIKGNLFAVTIHLHIRGQDFVINRLKDGHDDVHAAVRDAFDAAERQVKEHLRARRDAAKGH
jgi:ribosome-associated translation inhibitor RaiA